MLSEKSLIMEVRIISFKLRYNISPSILGVKNPNLNNIKLMKTQIKIEINKENFDLNEAKEKIKKLSFQLERLRIRNIDTNHIKLIISLNA